MGINSFNEIDKLYDKIVNLDIIDVINEKDDTEIKVEKKPKEKKKYDTNKWKKENPEKFKETHKKNLEKYRKNHREKMNEIEKKYYYKHREEILQKAKERYKKKKEQEKNNTKI